LTSEFTAAANLFQRMAEPLGKRDIGDFDLENEGLLK
jgi:hypothetical protein